MIYHKVDAVFNTIKAAMKEKHILYVFGAPGMGKTAAVRYYFRRKSCRLFSAENGYLEEMPSIEALTEEFLVFDDISLITDPESQQYIKQVIGERKQKIVLLSRASVPEWLALTAAKYSFRLQDDKLLRLDDTLLKELFKKQCSLSIDEEKLAEIRSACWDNTLMFIFLLAYANEDGVSAEMLNKARLGMYDYLNCAVYDRLDEQLRQLLVAVAGLDRFTCRTVELLTGDGRPRALILRLLRFGGILSIEKENSYSLTPMCRDYLRWKQEIVADAGEIRYFYERAALACELEESFGEALEYYTKSDKLGGGYLKALLRRLAERYPGIENFREVAPYYDKLEEKDIETSPELMAGYAIIHSLRFNPHDSEYWYEKLKTFARNAPESGRASRIAFSRLLYLDIVLPHRDREGLIETLMKIRELDREILTMDNEIISVMMHAPSLLNGTVDICRLYRDNRMRIETPQFMKDIQKALHRIFGRHVEGFMELVQLEWRYERDEIERNELYAAINRIYLNANAVGAADVALIAIRFLVRDYLLYSGIEAAREALLRFEKQLNGDATTELRQAIALLHLRLDMLNGVTHTVKEWLETQAPDSMESLVIMDRERYMCMLESLLVLERYDEAVALAERMIYACHKYHRDFDLMRCRTLKAILFYRRGNEFWQEELKSALMLGQSFGIKRTFGEWGNAVKPMLEKLSTEELDEEYLTSVCTIADQWAVAYPHYMMPMRPAHILFTKMEEKVIHLMCKGLSNKEMCSVLSLSESGLKFHRSNIYRKLEVNKRHEAERKLRGMGFLSHPLP